MVTYNISIPNLGSAFLKILMFVLFFNSLLQNYIPSRYLPPHHTFCILSKSAIPIL